MSEKPEYVKIHIKIEREIYEQLWEITKKEYIVPIKKFHLIVNKILKLGLEKYREQEESKDETQA